MKFSSQILDKSVPEWRHNNIDYNRIKQVIKSHQNNKQLLLNTFNEQFDIVNVFISLKIKEISTRIVSLESSIINMSQNQDNPSTCLTNDSINNENKLNNTLLRRKLKVIKNHANKCSKDLEKLLRFKIFQKIATKKLFQKILKYHDITMATQWIDDIKRLPSFTLGYENISFNNIDLNPYFLELSLIFDVISDFNARLKAPSGPDKHIHNLRKGSSTDYFIKEASYRAKSSPSYNEGSHVIKDKTVDKHILTLSEYDRIFLGESENIQRFLIPIEDIEEFKFMLLASSFQLFDEKLLSTSRDIIETTSNLPKKNSLSGLTSLKVDSCTHQNVPHLKTKPSTRSLRSFKDIPNIRSYASLLVTPQEQFHTDGLNVPTNLINTESSAPLKGTNVTYLILNDSTRNNNEINQNIFDNNSLNQFPNIIISYKEKLSPIIMCHIGGIRDHAVSDSIDKDTLDKVFLSPPFENTSSIPDMTQSHMDKLILEWIQTHHLQKYGPTIDSKRVRFIAYHQNNIYLLSISENIKINEQTSFPYCIFELRCTQKKVSAKFLDKLYSNLIEKKTNCYPISHELTLWKLALCVYQNKNFTKQDLFALVLADSYTIDDNNPLNEEEFFSLGKSAITELHSKDHERETHNLLPESKVSKLSEGKDATTHPKGLHIRYWNEFDDEEANPANNQSFYINDDEEANSILSNPHEDRGFITFERRFINDLFATCQKIKNVLTLTKPPVHPEEIFRDRYGSAVASNEELERLIQYQQQVIDESESLYELKHDEIVSLLYITALAISTLITGITVTVVATLFREESHNIEVPHKTIVITFIIFALVLALLLITLCLLLLFSRFTLAPTWHYVCCFILFTGITVGACYGVIEIYF